MTQISSQTFSFSPPQQDAQMFTQAGTVSSVPIDGASSVTVPFLQPFSQVCTAVQVQYTPSGGSDTGYQISTEVLPISPATSLAKSLNGFVLVARGGPIGATDSFVYEATGN